MNWEKARRRDLPKGDRVHPDLHGLGLFKTPARKNRLTPAERLLLRATGAQLIWLQKRGYDIPSLQDIRINVAEANNLIDLTKRRTNQTNRQLIALARELARP